MGHGFTQSLAQQLPGLKLKLQQAGMNLKPDEFIRRTFLGAFYMTTGITVSVFLALFQYDVLTAPFLFFIPVLFILFFFYMLKLPDVKITRKSKDISREIVFAGRFLVIELQSGVPLYNAFINLSRNYPVIGAYVKEIVDKVDLGMSMEDALEEAVELMPSDQFRKVLWQIITSLKTGSDISHSLSAIIDQISKEQAIEVARYGKKLTPLAMFYLMIAVIIPSIGMALLIILSSFVDFELTLSSLLILAFLLGFVQFMFTSMIKMSRPPVDF